MSEKLLCVREASQLLGISEKELIDLGQKNIIPCYRVGGEFYRFKRQDIAQMKDEIQRMYNISESTATLKERCADFAYFNSFYLGSALAIMGLLWLIFFVN